MFIFVIQFTGYKTKRLKIHCLFSFQTIVRKFNPHYRTRCFFGAQRARATVSTVILFKLLHYKVTSHRNVCSSKFEPANRSCHRNCFCKLSLCKVVTFSAFLNLFGLSFIYVLGANFFIP